MLDCTIKYYGYNGFIFEADGHKIAIDPGTSLYLPSLRPVIPRSEWSDVTHILVTHADPDHYWNADRMAQVSGAPIVCGSELVETRGGDSFLMHPRRRKVEYSVEIARAYSMDLHDEIQVDGINVRTIRANHGELRIPLLFGLLKKTVRREADTLFAKGETGFVITVGDLQIANLGDSLLLPEWGALEPDVLMIPIGGREVGNTMDEQDALSAIDIIKPKLVIPCHYDCGLVFRKRANPADTASFKKAVEERGVRCAVMQPGSELAVPPAIRGSHDFKMIQVA